MAIVDGDILEHFIDVPKWATLKAILGSAHYTGHSIEFLVATADGGKTAGIPHKLIQGRASFIPVVGEIYLQEDTHHIDFEIDVSESESIKIHLHIGVICGVQIDDKMLPWSFAVWPKECTHNSLENEESDVIHIEVPRTKIH